MAVFLIEKMTTTGKPKVRALRDVEKAGEVNWPPLTLRWLKVGGEGSRRGGTDERVEARWGSRVYRFAVVQKDGSTPKVVAEAVRQAREASRPPELWPMIVVPYLAGEQLGRLEGQEVSGIDLSGNGVVIVPGELLVFRTGKPNQYPQSFPIKNVYRRHSSTVARVFLLRPAYETVSDILREVESRGGEIALSTVSKVLSRLEDDLIVGREGGAIRLLEAEKLLQQLAANFEPPTVTERWLGKCALDLPEVMARVGAIGSPRTPLIVSGVSSTGRYATMAREETVSLYCRDLREALAALGPAARETDRFANLELRETADELVCFDRREAEGCVWASPIQTYLELARGDKRDQETAEMVRKLILRGLAERKEGT